MKMRIYLALIGCYTAVMCMAMIGCEFAVPKASQPSPVVVVQQPLPESTAVMSAEDYAEMSGFDASTEQTLREQVRNNDIEWRVAKLEREVRRLNQKAFGIQELRIGETPPTDEEE